MSDRLSTLFGVAAIALASAALPWLPGPPVAAYAALFIATSAFFLALVPALLRVRLTTRELGALLVLLVAARAALLPVVPVGSDDVYRYVWDGKVQAAGISPYAFIPAAPELQALHSETVPRLLNHPDLLTPYFPFAQWMFRLAYAMSGESLWGIKALILIAEVLSIAGLIALLREYGARGGAPSWTHPAQGPAPEAPSFAHPTEGRRAAAERVLLYAAAPLALFEFAVDAHVDALGFPFLVFGLLFFLRERASVGLVLLGLSMSIKPTPVVVLPFLFLVARGWRARAAVVVLPAFVLGLQFVPYLGDRHLFDGLFRLARDWMFNGSIFSLVFAVLPDNQRARLVCAGLLAVTLAGLWVWTIRQREGDGRVPVRAALGAGVLAVLLLLLFSPVVHPWYVGWLAVLLPIVPLPSGLALVGTVSLASLTVVTYQSTGVWVDYPLVRLAVYAPVFVLLVTRWRAEKRAWAA
jgi:hypothetical protein